VEIGSEDDYKNMFDIYISLTSRWNNYIINNGKCRDVSLSQNGYYAAVGLGKKVLVIHIDKHTTDIVETCFYNHKRWVTCVCSSQDGNYVASGSNDGEVKVYDIKNNKKIFAYEHDGRVFSVCFSPCGRYVASGSDDKKVKVYDIQSNKEIYSYKYDHFVKCICFSQDGNYVASGAGNRVIVHDIKNNKEIHSYEYTGSATCLIDYLHFSQNSEILRSTHVLSGTAMLHKEIVHRVSPKFYFNQKRYEAERKYRALVKADKKERALRLASVFAEASTDRQDTRENEENQESGVINLDFSIKFIDGKKVSVFKCFLNS